MKKYTESVSSDESLLTLYSIKDTIGKQLNKDDISIFVSDIEIGEYEVLFNYYLNHYPTDFNGIKKMLDDISNSLNKSVFKDYFVYSMIVKHMKEVGENYNVIEVKLDYKKIIKTDIYKNLTVSLKTSKKFKL